jgi:hypothetical protein
MASKEPLHYPKQILLHRVNLLLRARLTRANLILEAVPLGDRPINVVVQRLLILD